MNTHSKLMAKRDSGEQRNAAQGSEDRGSFMVWEVFGAERTYAGIILADSLEDAYMGLQFDSRFVLPTGSAYHFEIAE